MRFSLVGDSIFVAWHSLPCPTPGKDSVSVWRLPSSHGWCDGHGLIDKTKDEVTFLWTNCRPVPRRGEAG